ncbi:MAG: hypothetical protein HOV66_24125 [Streptomycetaceae bacterium]|nr:hypothetical protein [Streptomycetaceae bacterium]
MSDEISYVRIHPAIGIARVGNSTLADGWFYGPETPDPEPTKPGSHKDKTGAVKRQAARFRLYGYRADGTVVRELTTADTSVRIEWGVHVANRKAAWYEFNLAFDIPDMAGHSSVRRNKGVERAKLTIDPGRKVLDAASRSSVEFSGGSFMGVPVPLGSMHTDEAGRLVVLGGHGTSASPSGVPPTSYGNNDGWYDDTSDGPVTAAVSIGGKAVRVEPAWVVVAPPNYAPDIKTVRTLYDLLYDVFLGTGQLAAPPKVSFARDIEPILRRFVDLQWVNAGFAAHFGFGGPEEFTAPEMMRRLGSTSVTYLELRRQVYLMMRNHARDGLSPLPWPWFYGDAMASKPKSPLQYMTLSDTQIAMLRKWAEGDFDTAPWPGFPRRLEDAPVSDQPGLLDRAALDFCLADAFHPGCEVTWPIRHATMYAAPFRILPRPEGQAEPDYGEELTPEKVLAADGPLHAQGPGDLTRWMAIPWQTDTASCRSGYESQAGLAVPYDPYMPTFWPARVPNHVLTADDFAIVNKGGPGTDAVPDSREAAFARRATWLRGLHGTYPEQLAQAVTSWHKFGIVEIHDYTVGDGRFPKHIQVESKPGFDLTGVSPHRNMLTLHVPQSAAADAGVMQSVLSAAADATEFEGDEITVGYIDKLDPLGEERANGKPPAGAGGGGSAS